MPNPKWNAIIVDRLPTDSQLLKTMIKLHCPTINLLAEVVEISEALSCIQHLDINLVFCDVQLSDGTAFDLVDRLEAYKGVFIFSSSDEGVARRAFRYRAFDFLLKPVATSDLLETIERLDIQYSTPIGLDSASVDLPSSKKFDTLLLSAGGLQHLVHIYDIVRLEGDGNYSSVHLQNGEKIMVSRPLKHFEDILLAKIFFRIHQSHMVNIQNVKSVQNGDNLSVNLNNGDAVPVARRKKEPFLAWLSRYRI